jgi:hypothetical protein
MDLSIVSRRWKKIFFNALLCVQLFEFIKVEESIMVQNIGFVQDEKNISILTFMKMRLQNQLCEHLDLVVHMFAQLFYTIDTFPYNDAIIVWTDKKTRKVPLT